MSAKVLLVEDDHGRCEALSENVPDDAALNHTVQKALQCEASRFLPKPFRWQVLPRVIGRFYGTTRPRPRI